MFEQPNDLKKYGAFPLGGITDRDNVDNFLAFRGASLKEDGMVVAPLGNLYKIRSEIKNMGYKVGMPISGANDYKNPFI